MDADHERDRLLLDLLNPYGLLGGVTTLLVFLLHGAVFVALKTAGTVREDAVALAYRLSIRRRGGRGGVRAVDAVAYGKGWTWIPMLFAAVALVGAIALHPGGALRGGRSCSLRSRSSGTFVLLFGSLYPNVMPSPLTTPPTASPFDDASSSHYTLVVMTWVAVVVGAGGADLPGVGRTGCSASVFRPSRSRPRSGCRRRASECPAAQAAAADRSAAVALLAYRRVRYLGRHHRAVAGGDGGRSWCPPP